MAWQHSLEQLKLGDGLVYKMILDNSQLILLFLAGLFSGIGIGAVWSSREVDRLNKELQKYKK